MNWRLASAIFSIVSTVMMGVLLTVCLILGYDSMPVVIGAVLSGLVLSMPIAYLVTKRILTLAKQDQQANSSSKTVG